MYSIVREFEIAPGVWSSRPVVVGSTPSAAIAAKAVDEKNATEGFASRRLRHRYAMIAAND